ncbi:hypothetical protein Ancab_036661 [Ancistrocladus abbreviatus]
MEDAIVLYPAPGMGHIVSMIELAKLINHHYSHRFSITIFLTNGPFDTSNTDDFISHISQTHPHLFFLRFPYIAVDSSPTRSRAATAFEFIRLNDPNVLNSLTQISKTSRIRALIVDLFCTSALSISSKLKIPTYCFFTSGVAALVLYLYMPTIHKQHTKSFKDLKGTILHFPGLPPIPAHHMPEPTLDRLDPAYDDMLFFTLHLPKFDGIIVNTFDDLEPVAVAAVRDGSSVPDMPIPSVFNIGPLIASVRTNGDGGEGENGAGRHECLQWLDLQPRESVVFLCFGSKGVFGLTQLREIADGLERSGRRFLWVVRNPPDSKGEEIDLESLLPEGFLEKTMERGMLLKNWAPQVEVLSHDSVGGFVTHCGWNSVLEAIVAGKPMVAWPLYAEQHVNKAALVEDMKMAIPVEEREADGLVSGEELARRLGELMDSDKGKELREKSKMMKERSLAAWEENGSSITALAELTRIWMQD